MDDNGGSLVLPEVIVTKRNRTESVCGRIEDDCCRGTVKYFCRSRGHGFIVPENVSWCIYSESLSLLGIIYPHEVKSRSRLCTMN